MHTSTYRDSQKEEITKNSSLFRNIKLMTVEVKVNTNRISYLEEYETDFFVDAFLYELSDAARPLYPFIILDIIDFKHWGYTSI